jgi:hypothetical protein
VNLIELFRSDAVGCSPFLQRGKSGVGTHYLRLCLGGFEQMEESLVTMDLGNTSETMSWWWLKAFKVQAEAQHNSRHALCKNSSISENRDDSSWRSLLETVSEP